MFRETQLMKIAINVVIILPSNKNKEVVERKSWETCWRHRHRHRQKHKCKCTQTQDTHRHTDKHWREWMRADKHTFWSSTHTHTHIVQWSCFLLLFYYDSCGFRHLRICELSKLFNETGAIESILHAMKRRKSCFKSISETFRIRAQTLTIHIHQKRQHWTINKALSHPSQTQRKNIYEKTLTHF